MSANSVVAPVLSNEPEKLAQTAPPSAGLTSTEARSRLERDGPNAMPDTSVRPLRNALTKFWAPVPWLCEAAIVLAASLPSHK